jgi:hypothetical protein
MDMFVQRWQVGLTLSHLTFAREQASQEARILRGFGAGEDEGAKEGLRGRAVLSMVGEGDCWGVNIWGIDWNMARESECGVCVWVVVVVVVGRTWGAERVS